MDMMKTGGQAFPTSDSQTAHAIAAAAVEGVTDSGERDRVYTAARAQAMQGMTLRDYFAAQALTAMIGLDEKDCGNRGAKAVPTLAKFAYEYADAMLAERAK
jgi:hypothetical protein